MVVTTNEKHTPPTQSLAPVGRNVHHDAGQQAEEHDHARSDAQVPRDIVGRTGEVRLDDLLQARHNMCNWVDRLTLPVWNGHGSAGHLNLSSLNSTYVMSSERYLGMAAKLRGEVR